MRPNAGTRRRLLACVAAVALASLEVSAAPTAKKPPVPPRPPAKAGIKLHNPPAETLRPEHIMTKLTPETFDEFVTKAVDDKKTAFVRWMMSSDTHNCSWITEKMDWYNETVHGSACSLVAKQAQAWNSVAQQYRDSPDVVFGYVIASDHPESLKKIIDVYGGHHVYGENSPDHYGNEHHEAEFHPDGGNLTAEDYNDLDGEGHEVQPSFASPLPSLPPIRTKTLFAPISDGRTCLYAAFEWW